MTSVFKQGDDSKIIIPIVETPAIDFNTAEDIKVILFIDTVEQKKYSLGQQTGYGVVEIDSVNANQLNVFVERDHSVNFAVGAVRAYILAKFQNAEFPDGNQVKSWELIVGRVMAGMALDEAL